MEYINIEKEDLDRILENHKHYLNEDCENWKSMRADLSDIDLSGIDLSGICLFDADLEGANLEGTNLRNAVLSYANLRGANLYEANLKFAILCDSNLYNANLIGANLSRSSLVYSNLGRACMRGADLTGADFRYTIIFMTKGLPNYYKGEMLTQDIIGYKKCINDIIVTLKIPRGAIVFSINDNKCRTNKAVVLDIEDEYGNKLNRAISRYKYMSYYIGDEITVYTFNCQYNIECSTGIHFFKTKEAAKDFHI